MQQSMEGLTFHIYLPLKIAESFYSNCHFYKCQPSRHAVLHKLTLIWIITKSLSQTKSLELFPVPFGSNENRTAISNPFPFPFPCPPVRKYYFMSQKVLHILRIVWDIILCYLISVIRIFFIVHKSLIGCLILFLL